MIEKDNIVQFNMKSTLLEASKGKKVGSTVVNTYGWARNSRMESTQRVKYTSLGTERKLLLFTRGNSKVKYSVTGLERVKKVGSTGVNTRGSTQKNTHGVDYF